MTLETTIERVDGPPAVTVLALEGELDASNFEALIDTVRTLYDDGTRRLVIDLSSLTFMASSGLVALHSIVRIMHGEPPPDPEGGWSALHAEVSGPQEEVVLAGPQPGVARVLARTGLDQLFTIHEDREAALAAS
ncbi:MAG TPA: STAS domain-containing protein [Candidatus Saccharimonadales bacterium]|nr:STAS domain-containing protein [Candidatus Saccharimonadales bacterium]